MSAQPGGGGLGQRQRRAPAACEFCRHRKMKCDNLRPACRGCKEHGRECIYADLAKKPRPSYARISHLEEESRRLQGLVASLTKQLEDSGFAPTQEIMTPMSYTSNIQYTPAARIYTQAVTPQELNQLPTPAEDPRDLETASASFSPDKESGYHGPTSAAYDEETTDGKPRHNETGAKKVPEAWVKCQLVAESANQRQLETVNLLAGKLDFDGVEPELGIHLLSIYWNRQHSFGPVVYRTAFMRDMACSGPYFSKLLLNAIYFYASKYTPRTEVRRRSDDVLTAGWMFRKRATELLAQCFGRSSVTTIQALLMISTAVFTWCDEKSTSWLYAGMAFNMITDLGIHIGSAGLGRSLSEEEVEIRTRVFWAAYVIDKVQSLYQGRPARLCTAGENLRLPTMFRDDHEELELFDSYTYAESSASRHITPQYSISTFVETCKLSIMLHKILSGLYSETSELRDLDDLQHEASILQEEIHRWRLSLPSHLDIDGTGFATRVVLPHTLALLATQNVMTILVHRPMVSNIQMDNSSPSVTIAAFSACSEAASEIDRILHLYEENFCMKTAPYIISYATYVSATIHVRIAAQCKPGSVAHKALRNCLAVLDTQQSVGWSPRRAKRVIDRLVTSLGVDINGQALANADFHESLRNIDINMVVKSLARQRQNGDSLVQDARISVEPSLNMDSSLDNSAVEFWDAHTNGYTSVENQMIPPISEDFGFLFDPIFGFDGSSFDDMGFVWDEPYQNCAS